jgi:transcriptional regulator with XRE-family HTH domain
MPRLSNDERNRAVTMLLQGATQQEVATALGVHPESISQFEHLYGGYVFLASLWQFLQLFVSDCGDT